MAIGSLLTTAAIVAGFIAAAAALYLFIQAQTTPRPQRVGLVERASLDGGRKLLLVRRDGVEHLILIGGPIDLVVETGIKSDGVLDAAIEERQSFDVSGGFREEPSPKWPFTPPRPTAKSSPAEPRLPLTAKAGNKDEDMLELSPLQEAKKAL